MSVRRIGPWIVDLERHEARRDGELCKLTVNEAGLIAYLLARPGRVVPREELLREVWGYAEGVRTRTVDSTLSRLRKKLEAPGEPEVFVAVYGKGYGVAETLAAAPEPEERGAFVGRTEDLAALRRLLGAHRLVTLLGPAGVGKTRLARQWIAQGRARVLFAELTTARDALGALSVVTTLLGLAPDDRDPAMAAADALAARGTLVLVLDDAEGVADALRPVVPRWLERSPRLTVLVTSRVALGVPGEQLLAVDPLPEADALALLQERSRGVRPLSDEDALRVVRAVEGLPLALELAAARTRVLDADQLLARLDALADPSALGRHASLEAALAVSWDLLSDAQRRVLAVVSVFRGSFDAPVAEALCGEPALDALDALVRSSLVRPLPGPRARFRLLGAIRRFAARHATPEARRAHARWAVDLGSELADRLVFVRGDPATMEELRAIGDELAAVVDRFPGTSLEVASVVALAPMLESVGPLARLEALVAHASVVVVEPALRARLEVVRLRVATLTGRGDPELRVALEGGLPDRLVAMALETRGELHQARGRYPEALGDHTRAAELFEAADCPLGRATALHATGLVYLETGRPDAAREPLREAYALHRAIGNLRGEVVTLDHLGLLALQTGQLAEALDRLRTCQERAAILGDRRNDANLLTHLGIAWRKLGRPEEAERAWHEALRIHREVGNVRFEAVTLGNLGMLWLEQGRTAEAVDVLDLALVHARRRGDRGTVASLQGALGLAHHLRGALAEARRSFDEALEAQLAAGRHRSACVTRLNRGVLLWEQGEQESSAVDLREATTTPDPRFRGLALAWLGALFEDRPASEEAAVLLADLPEDAALHAFLRGEDVPPERLSGADGQLARRILWRQTP